MDECESSAYCPYSVANLSPVRHLHIPHLRPSSHRAQIQIRSLSSLPPDNTPTSPVVCQLCRTIGIAEEAGAGQGGVGGAEENRCEGAAECRAEGGCFGGIEHEKGSDIWSIQRRYRRLVSLSYLAKETQLNLSPRLNNLTTPARSRAGPSRPTPLPGSTPRFPALSGVQGTSNFATPTRPTGNAPARASALGTSGGDVSFGSSPGGVLLNDATYVLCSNFTLFVD
jgi:hypothetical protein